MRPLDILLLLGGLKQTTIRGFVPVALGRCLNALLLRAQPDNHSHALQKSLQHLQHSLFWTCWAIVERHHSRSKITAGAPVKIRLGTAEARVESRRVHVPALENPCCLQHPQQSLQHLQHSLQHLPLVRRRTRLRHALVLRKWKEEGLGAGREGIGTTATTKKTHEALSYICMRP